MGEAERGESAPRQRVIYFCAHRHQVEITFAVEAAVPESWDCPKCGLPASLDSENPPPAPRIREPVYIDERPVEVEGRQVPGHWEGDLIIGKDGKTAVATLVERMSRFLILVPLTGRDSLTVGDAVIAATHGLPDQIRRSLTWDCGSEMARHATITATGAAPRLTTRCRIVNR